MRFYDVSYLAKGFGPRRRRQSRPGTAFERSSGRTGGAVDVFEGGFGDIGNDLVGCRIEVLERFTAGGFHKLATNKKRHFLNLDLFEDGHAYILQPWKISRSPLSCLH